MLKNLQLWRNISNLKFTLDGACSMSFCRWPGHSLLCEVEVAASCYPRKSADTPASQPLRFACHFRELPWTSLSGALATTPSTFVHLTYAHIYLTMRLSLMVSALVASMSSLASATALTYKLAANEKSCFFTNVEQKNTKVAFYFAVSFSSLANSWEQKISGLRKLANLHA